MVGFGLGTHANFVAFIKSKVSALKPSLSVCGRLGYKPGSKDSLAQE